MTIEQRLERVGQVADWIDIAHLAVGDKACVQCPVFRADLVTGEECVLGCQSKSPFILPMSGRSWKSITAGIPIVGTR